MKWTLEKTGMSLPILNPRDLATFLRERTSRDTLYTHVDMYTRRVLDSCFRIRERGEKEQTRGSPVPRGLGVLSYLGRAAWWEEGGKDAGPYLRDPLLGPLSLSWPVLSNPSACLFASSPSFSMGRQRRPRSFSSSPSISLSLSLLLLPFLTFNSALSGSDLYLFVTTTRAHLWTFVKYVSASRW